MMRVAALVILLLSVACAPPVRPRPEPRPALVAPVTPVAPPPAVLPDLTVEPRLRVLIHRGASTRLRLQQPATAAGQQLAPGLYVVTAAAGQLIINGRPLARGDLDLVFTGAGRATAAFDHPGDVRRFGGDLNLLAIGREVAVIELIGLETFLYGTLAREVGQAWPLESLKAQSVAARSYAVSQYLRQHRRPWHLQAYEVIDMAYAGIITEPHPHLQTAIDQTRGDLLFLGENPLPAYFHSCSGGTTESPRNVWPQRRCADGVTEPALAMPVVGDRWAEVGAAALRMPTAWSWRAEMTLADLGRRLFPKQAVKVSGVGIGARFADSGRVRTVTVTLVGGGGKEVDGNAFRLAVGPHLVRSTLWTSCRVAGGRLVITGRGFGHGVGLSQVSAYAMAKEGRSAPEILRHFYPGARLVRRW
jgi:peptidoglycan hydrolase-like amidase